MEKEKTYTATRNACKLCSPLGASIAFKGLEACVPLIHGSQGCATYIRRYLISHYKEPVDIASTNFSEESAVYGGEKNLFSAIDNVTRQYRPDLIAIATTCLSETIGDDMDILLNRYKVKRGSDREVPELLYVNTPSFKGTHADAFHHAVLAVIKSYADFEGSSHQVNLLPGFLSTADLRYLKTVMEDVGIEAIVLPDYSDTLDYGYTGKYERIPAGGTPRSDLKRTGSSRATIQLGTILNRTKTSQLTPGSYLEEHFSIPCIHTGIPIGIRETDAFFEHLTSLGGSIPMKYIHERGRLVDAYIDGHKYVFGKRAVVYGEEDFVVAMASFLDEIGMEVVLCASGGESGILQSELQKVMEKESQTMVMQGADFEDIASACRALKPDIMLGSSKAYYIARELDIPLIRAGFPIHDRLGGQRIRHLGYSGSLELFDRVSNALIQYKQDHSPVGYKYM
jgi:nitrogenase molybdenum-iron protein NifN